MRASTILVTFLATLTFSAPTGLTRRAGVLGTATYNELSISGGVAGKAEAEALTKFSALDLTDLANIDQADIDFLGAVNDIANDAETDAFNIAIAAASGDKKIGLQNGKIKNKVLKLQATVLQLQIQAAQGKDTAAKLATEQKKLDGNIATDVKNAGQASTFLSFDAST